MSRFFDVLNRAGLHPASQMEKPADLPPETLQDAELPVLEALGEALGTEAGSEVQPTPPTHLPEDDSREGIGEIHPPASHVPVHSNGSFGVRVRIRMDPGMRAWTNAIDHAVLEHYGLLRTQILQRHKDQPFKSLLVTSPGPQQGKTLTTLNLAFLFAKLPSFKVLVIEGDLRRGNLQRSLGLESSPGLSNLLEGTAKPKEVVLKSEEMSVDFILRGSSSVSPAELLHSLNLRAYLRSFAKQYDLVFVDSPPVNLVEDTQLLAASCDAVLLVARPFLTSCKELADASQALMRHRIIGAVLNGANSVAPYQRYRAYY